MTKRESFDLGIFLINGGGRIIRMHPLLDHRHPLPVTGHRLGHFLYDASNHAYGQKHPKPIRADGFDYLVGRCLFGKE